MTASPPDATATVPVTRSMRGLMYVAALLVFLAGVQLYVFPLRTEEYFAWTVKPPMSAVFLGGAYWSSVLLEFLAARARAWTSARITVVTVLAFTVLTFGITALHLDRFHLAAEHPLATRAVTWAWLAIYAIVPVAMIVVLAVQVRQARKVHDRVPPAPPPARLPVGARFLVLVLTVLLLGMGGFLLIAPEQAGAWWPWPLTPLTGRAIGAWLVGFGIAGGYAYVLNDRTAVRPLSVTTIAFVVLQAGALVRHGGDLAWRLPAAAYLCALVLILAVGVWTLRRPTAE